MWAGLVLCLALPAYALANHEGGNVVRVTLDDMKGWAFAQETPNGSGMMVSGPPQPPLGTGSAQLQVDSTGGWILAKAAYQGTPLRDFTKLTY